jgi:hypothetical protein
LDQFIPNADRLRHVLPENRWKFKKSLSQASQSAMLQSLPFHPIRRVRRESNMLGDPVSAVREAIEPLRSLLNKIPLGAPVAVTAGSRGIDRMALVVRATCAVLKEAGASPYVVPAMGSHGGATAEGQRRLLAQYGITEESIEVPIVSSMETVSLGTTREGIKVFMDRAAWESRRVVVLNRVKSHTDFHGVVESGLMKMMAVGLGKLEGARSFHKHSMNLGFETAILAMGRHILGTDCILAGMGLVENDCHRLCEIASAPAIDVETLDRRLLTRARALHAKLPFPSLDLLIVDEIGKNVSGAGMDPKVIGRYVHPEHPPRDSEECIAIRRIYIRDLTPESAGNAIGMGLADLMHGRINEKIDFDITYTNASTSLAFGAVRMPMSFASDYAALEFLQRNLGAPSPDVVRAAWIRNTLSLDAFLATPACASDLAANPDYQVGPSKMLEFDQAGNMKALI